MFDTQEYTFKVQVPGSSSKDEFLTAGKADLDMADYVDEQLCVQNRSLVMKFKVGTATGSGAIKLIITTQPMGKVTSEDGTEISAITGMSSDAGAMRKEEQDLRG